MKSYLLFAFALGCEPMANNTQQNTFEDFDQAFAALEALVQEEWPMVDDIPKPKRPGPYNFSHKGDHYQIWEVKRPEDI